MESVDAVEAQVDRILPDIRQIRHKIHENPELSLREFETAALVRDVLSTTQATLLEPFLSTDVVAILRGDRKGKNVTLRADMDALPLREESGHSYRSRNDGIMHACGHDGHTAMLLGAAMVLNSFTDRFDGSVRFVFQPGEEVVAAGRDLVARGALENPEPDALFALHAWSGIPEGAISSKPGVFLVAADFFSIVIEGRESHGSTPEDSIDPILTAARVVEGLQAIPSRMVSSLDSVVVSVCRISGGTNSNIIPGRVDLEGTVRYLNSETGELIPRYMERIVRGICDAMGATYSFSYSTPYIPTVNHPEIVALGEEVTTARLGPSQWVKQ